jgi:hypothetical protein
MLPTRAEQGACTPTRASQPFGRACSGGAIWPGRVKRRRWAQPIGGSAGGVVIEPDIEAGQVELVIDEVIQCMFEGAGEKLPLQVNGKETGAGVDVFVAGHAVGAIMNSMTQC